MQLNLHQQIVISLKPVSYTHLDVYKRQVEMFAKQLNQYFDSEMSIQGTTDLEKSLVGTDYIFLSLAVDLSLIHI